MSKKKAEKKTPAKKTAARKSAAGKTAAAKKKTTRSAAKKTVASTAKKKASRSNAAKKTSAGTSTAARRKAPSKKAASAKKKQPAAKKKSPAAKKTAASPGTASNNEKSSGSAKAEGNRTSPRAPAAKSRPVAFSLEEAQTIAKARSSAADQSKTSRPAQPAPEAAPKKSARAEDPKPPARVLGAASLSDILGRSPDAAANPIERRKEDVPKKFSRYYNLLMELREHVLSELDLHTKDTLKRSTKEDSGNLSNYGQHMADAGTDSFDRDFALSLVSTEQEALAEIEAAIHRIHKGTYGICEITGKPIARERLLAVPFARYSVEGQVEYEKNQKRPNQRGGAYLDSGGDSNEFMSDDPDE